MIMVMLMVMMDDNVFLMMICLWLVQVFWLCNLLGFSLFILLHLWCFCNLLWSLLCMPWYLR